MSRDDDLVTTCSCGCTEVIRRGGYHTSDWHDAVELGRAAGELCRPKPRWKRPLLLLALLLITTSATFAVMDLERRRVETAEKLSWKGERLLAGKRYAEAVETYTEVIRLHPSARAYLSRSFANAELGRLKASLDDCQLAVDLEPKNQAARRTLELAKAELADNR